MTAPKYGLNTSSTAQSNSLWCDTWVYLTFAVCNNTISLTCSLDRLLEKHTIGFWGGKGRDMGQISAISGVSRSLYSKCLQWFVSSLITSLVELPHRAEGSCREVIFICRSIKMKILISVALKEAATTSELCDNVWYDAHVQPLNVAHH